MEDDNGMRELVELIFGKKPTMPKKMVAHLSIYSNVLTQDFSKKLKDVLRLRKHIVYYRWNCYFDSTNGEMLSSHEKYLFHLIFVCLFEHKCNRNLFGSFISVCVLVINLGNEILAKTGMDFRDLNPDIIMVFYQNVWKISFIEHGGLYEFVEYICNHNYLELHWDENDPVLFDDDTASVDLKQDLRKFLEKEFNSYRPSEEISLDIDVEMYETIMHMVQEVLSTTSVNLPTLLSESELVKRLVDFRKREITYKAEKNRRVEATSAFETSHGNSSSNPDSTPNYFVAQHGEEHGNSSSNPDSTPNYFVAQHGEEHGNSSSNSDSKPNYFVAQHGEDIAWYESIVQAVIKHNHSNISHHENAQNPKLLEAEETLEQLKTSIKSLIEVLDEL